MKKSGMGKIRGYQMSNHLGARINPCNNYENDICIYVKSKPVGPICKKTWLDVGDQILYHRFIRKHPECGIISISKSHMNVMREIFPRDRMFLIPEHHCNFERFINPKRKPLIAGVIGGWNSFKYSHDLFSSMLKSIELKWFFEPNFACREHVVEFYKKIDIQVVYRPNTFMSELCNPLKLANAGSFGIPTIAFPEPSYKSDFEDAFMEALNIDEIVDHLKLLVKDESYYDMWRTKALVKSEEFHINNISDLYYSLDW